MGAAVELKDEGKGPNDPLPEARWTPPVAAYSRYRPGLSPYMHYWQQLRAGRDQAPPPKDGEAGDGASLPRQMNAALDALIRRSFDE